MAKQRLNTVNFVYTAVGLAVAAGVGYYAWRRLRAGKAHAGGEEGEGGLMEVRRQTRKAGRAVKDQAQQAGKAAKRAASDAGEAFEDANSSGQELLANNESVSNYR